VRALVALAAVMSIGPTLVLAASAAADPPAGFATVKVLGGVDEGPGGGPTSFAYAPDGRIFIGRKTGVVDVWDNGVQHTFIDLRDDVNSVQSRGLVGLTVDPNFASNGRVYVLYTQELRPDDPDQGYPAGGQLISIKGKASDPDTADPATKVVLLSGVQSTSRLHSVAGLKFDNNGNLLVGLADASDNGVNQGQALAAEDLNKLNGKLLRIDPSTGLGIPGNPWYDAASPGSVRSRVFAFGLRNPFRFTVDPENGNVYVGEVGWNTWEQLEVFTPTYALKERDRNAGWPCYEGGNGVSLVQGDYQAAPVSAPTCHAIYKQSEGGTGPGSLAPVYGYRHDEVPKSVGSAIVGGPKYTGTSNYPSQYIGKLFIGDFARDGMKTVDPTTGAATDFGTLGSWGSPVDIQIAPDGNVAWLGIASGELREIIYTGGTNRPPTAVAHANPTYGPSAPMLVHFSSAGSTDPDPGDTLTYDWQFGDGRHSTKPNPSHQYLTTGAFTAILTVSDGHPGGQDSAPVQIGVADAFPTISYTSPDPGLRYAVGDTIHVDLLANDTEDGPLSGDSVQTSIVEHTGGHDFPGGDFSGLSGSFVAADLGFEDTHYELISTATDSTGLKTTVRMDVLPATVPVTIASVPSGVSMTVDGVSQVTPYTSLGTYGFADVGRVVNDRRNREGAERLQAGNRNGVVRGRRDEPHDHRRGEGRHRRRTRRAVLGAALEPGGRRDRATHRNGDGPQRRSGGPGTARRRR
jgi:glucose/arabinose dehydrogenase